VCHTLVDLQDQQQHHQQQVLSYTNLCASLARTSSSSRSRSSSRSSQSMKLSRRSTGSSCLILLNAGWVVRVVGLVLQEALGAVSSRVLLLLLVVMMALVV
jgi:hypothetical protein